ncbi:MAG: SH3 domain-containing protein [Lachnospiraceae bacterium]|nr:SH3 domain-containing protein [Lachnospiraceae bacterium]MDE6233777.1 SH3 domain-containing protein [Lachnospiraceae bacterium]MDE6253001.1 SH3 domain-containing protein [Lachnospiraceae bacterium]
MITKNFKRIASIFILLLVLVTTQTSVSAYENYDSPKVNAPWIGQVTTASMDLNIRSNPSTSSTVISTLKKGTNIQIIGENGNWWRVRYTMSGNTGYVTKEYITIVSKSYGYVNTQSLDLYLRDINTHNIIGTIPKGTYLPIFPSEDYGWIIVLYGQTTGVVSSEYFKYK